MRTNAIGLDTAGMQGSRDATNFVTAASTWAGSAGGGSFVTIRKNYYGNSIHYNITKYIDYIAILNAM